MKINNRIFFCFLILVSFFVSGQDNTLLHGEWKLEKRIRGNQEREEILGGAQPNLNLKLTFDKEGVGYDSSSETEFEYTLSDKKLLLGSRAYELIKVTNDSLIIREQEDLYSLSQETLIFVKIEN